MRLHNRHALTDVSHKLTCDPLVPEHVLLKSVPYKCQAAERVCMDASVALRPLARQGTKSESAPSFSVLGLLIVGVEWRVKVNFDTLGELAGSR